MTYTLVQLAAGAYDVERAGEIIASLVRGSTSDRWYAELLDDRLPHPAPFTAGQHSFRSLGEAIAWLGKCTNAGRGAEAEAVLKPLPTPVDGANNGWVGDLGRDAGAGVGLRDADGP